ERPQKGFVVTTEKDYTLALDTTLDENLVSEGLIRELIRQIQVMRKDTGYAVDQRVTVEITGEDDFAIDAIEANLEKICSDILASNRSTISNPDSEKVFSVQGYDIKVKLKKI
ncbi:MAG: DUF5915 domain-containing protein, partial [Clostridia bacterium]|nr:DUF5915 domain-containing protein [Clostridia bacterium]